MAAIGLQPLCLANLKDSAPSNAIRGCMPRSVERMETNEVHALSMKTFTPLTNGRLWPNKASLWGTVQTQSQFF
jgi:hypothetical protein